MRKAIKLGFILVAASMLIGCGGGGSGDSVANNSGNGSTGGFANEFKARSINDQVEELLDGIIIIADEVGSGKMGDPLGESIDKADTTLVESQFSWNSTMDFYNNIKGINEVWHGGLKGIVNASQPEEAEEITTIIDEALASIVAISDYDGDGKLETEDLIAEDGLMAFRQQILNEDGRKKIQNAIDKILSLRDKIEKLKGQINPTNEHLTLAAKVVDEVIVSNYEKLSYRATTLLEKLTELKNNPSADTVKAARDAWRATRIPWERSEAYLFGPVDTLGVDPKVDSWPVQKDQLDGALGGYDPELSNIDGFPVNMKGFHAIEYLLFGDGTTLEPAEDAAARLQTPVGEEPASDKLRLVYLEALGKSLQKDLQSLVDAWK